MISNSTRSRLAIFSFFVICLLAAALKFGTVSKADSRPLPPMSLMSGSGVASLYKATMATKPGSKLAPEVLEDTANGRVASVVIFLADQADVSAAYSMKDQDARGWYVYNTLTEHAARTQADIKSFLNARGVKFHSFWAANMVVAEVDQTLAEEIAARSDVARVDPNRPARGIEDPAIADQRDATESPEAVESGVTNVKAPQMWALGYTGQGIIIANQDTGMRWTHNAIKGHYRGWNGTAADHNYNWHDSIHSGGGVCGVNSMVPCDDDTSSTHGTHTTGTTSGDDGAGNQIGVAPGAKWIGCRNMDQGNGTPATYSECFQFFIAPTDLTGNNPNPTLRPHVMNNSWGCPASEGCVTRAELETVVNNTQAAGIFVVVSAGNSGSSCSSVTDAPAIYSSSFSVGAISGTSNSLATFSSRGPSTYYTPNLLKPNISAPGVSVRSSQAFSDTTYGTLSGTSMAGPHVVGVVALLWSARPELVRDIAATKTLLQNTANPGVTLTAQTCGGISSSQIPNNSFGYGRIDALAAFNAAGPTPTPTSTPTSTPTNTPTNTPTATPTNTPTATPTNTPTATPTNTPTATPTNTPTATPTSTPTATPTPAFRRAFDYDGDGKADVSLFRPSNGVWYLLRSAAGESAVQFGSSTDKIVPSDYDGDGKTDEAVYRAANGAWYMFNSSTSTASIKAFGTAQDLPAPGDYDGDGKADNAVFRPSTGTWWIDRSSLGLTAVQFGANGDIPAPGDYDGDGKNDLVVYRPSTGVWYMQRSRGGEFAIKFGDPTDKIAPADYDGDGRTDVAVYRPSQTTWYIVNSSNSTYPVYVFGSATDIPVPADYDGDGKADIAIFRPSNGQWWLNRSTSGLTVVQYGSNGDEPSPNAYGN